MAARNRDPAYARRYILGVDGAEEDGSLVRRAQRGDRRAFDQLVVRHRDRVYAVTLRLTRDPADAEDALQDTFLRAYRGLAGFGRRSKVSTWLYRIAVNASYDVMERRRPAASLDDDAVPDPASPHDPYVQSAERRALEEALGRLPADFREAVVLCDVAGLGAGEAADVLGLPAGTVKSRVFRARALLAEMLREPTDAGRVEGAG
jgi:RNA polymerase sigma-70 factor, ECF subfamily